MRQRHWIDFGFVVRSLVLSVVLAACGQSTGSSDFTSSDGAGLDASNPTTSATSSPITEQTVGPIGFEVLSDLGYPVLSMAGTSCGVDNPERGPWTITYFVDFPEIGLHTGPPIELKFEEDSTSFSYSLDQGHGYYAWYGSGIATLVKDESSEWKITFSGVTTEFRSGGEVLDAPSPQFPELALEPLEKCPDK